MPGPQFVDIFYVGGVFAVAAFGGRQDFDSAFAENTDEFRPPMPGQLPGPLRNLPFIGGGERGDPEEEAEMLRQKVQEAAEAGDMETAFRTEKELKQLLAETGVRYMADESREENLPERW